MYVCMCVCVCARVHAQYMFLNVCIYAYMRKFFLSLVNRFIDREIDMYICIYVCMNTVFPINIKKVFFLN